MHKGTVDRSNPGDYAGNCLAAEEFKKRPNLNDDEQQAVKMKFMAEYFTPAEWRRAQNISHWDCQDHGPHRQSFFQGDVEFSG